MPTEVPGVGRVLMTADGVGGVWPYTLDLCSGLAAHGIETTVAVMGPALRESQRADAARRGIQVIEGSYALEWMQDPWTDVDRAGAWLLRLAEALKPDLVHLNGYAHASLPWRVPAVVVGHSCVRSWWRGVHGDDAPPAWDRYTEVVARGLRAAHLVVAPTQTMLADLAAIYGPLPAARVIPNGHAAAGQPAPAARDELVFCAGRIWDEAKNIDALCAVAPSLAWPVCVAGDNTLPGRACAATGYVRHLGFLPADEVRRWYARAAIFSLPARYEPFGLSVLEAAANGCALVLGDIRTLRENWHGAALFVPPDNRRALAAAIRSLIDDPVLRAGLAGRARERAGRFTLSAMTGAYLSAYGDLVRSAVAA